jgi:DNA-binding NtrC family response regulator
MLAGHEESLRMIYTLGVITQDRGLEKVMERISNHFGYALHIFESCTDFVDDSNDSDVGVVVVDGSVCSQPRLMDLQMVLNEAPNWRVLYLPRTNKKDEIKEAVELGAFGSLHKPLSEQEVRQMVQSAIGI